MQPPQPHGGAHNWQQQQQQSRSNARHVARAPASTARVPAPGTDRQPRERRAGGRQGSASTAQQQQPTAVAPPTAGTPAATPPAHMDATTTVRSELREAIFAADGARLRAAVQQADLLGLEREAAHARKKLEAML
jgi:hypothetical protein